jgi:type II secretory pathway pseudopilin PulG
MKRSVGNGVFFSLPDVLIIVGILLGACTTPRLQSDIQKREEERLQMLLRRNQELIANIRYYEAKLDTLEKMRSAQVKGLYRVR